jgi:hypothetical protein
LWAGRRGEEIGMEEEEEEKRKRKEKTGQVVRVRCRSN